MKKSIHVLVLEDRAADAETVIRELKRSGFDPQWKRVETEADYLAALDSAPDLILSDYNLPQFDGRRALELLRGRGLDIPFILITGTLGEETAVEIMRLGASDFLLKDRIARLGGAVERVMEEQRLRVAGRRAENAIRESETHLRHIVQSLPSAVYTCDARGRITLFNEAAVTLWGQTPKLGEDLFCGSLRIFYLGGRPMAIDECPMAVALREDRPVRGQEIWVERPDGSRINVLPYPTPLHDSHGVLTGAVNMLLDITEQKRAEEARRQRTEELERFNRLSVGRELRMIELKKEVNELAAKLGQTQPYPGGDAQAPGHTQRDAPAAQSAGLDHGAAFIQTPPSRNVAKLS